MPLEQPIAGYNGNPQIEDGHTKIANELLDAIILTDFSKRQLKIILFIIRKTYGFNKKSDDISRSQIADATGLLNPHITKTMNELKTMNVVNSDDGKYAKHYRLNKKYDEWNVTKTVPGYQNSTGTKTVTRGYQNSNDRVPKQYPQKTTPKDNTKDNIAIPKKTESSCTIKTYMERCKSEGRDMIPPKDPLFKFAETAQIPIEFLELAWKVFRDSMIEKNKKQKDWVQTFRNYVKNDYLKLWYSDLSSGQKLLNQKGRDLKTYYENKNGTI